MKKTAVAEKTVALIVLLSFLGLAGCPKPSKSPEKPKSETGDKQKQPKSLKKLDKDVETLLKEVGKKRKLQEEMAKGGQQGKQGEGKQGGQGGQQSGQQGGGQQSGGQGGGSQSSSSGQSFKGIDGEKAAMVMPNFLAQGTSGGGGQGGQQGGDQGGQQGGQGGQQGKQGGQAGGQQGPEQQLADWKKEEKALEDIHKQWNSFEPEAVKAGVPAENIIAFETHLAVTTSAVEAKDITATLNAANEMVKDISFFKEQFKQEEPPVTDRMTYYTQGTMLAADQGRWLDAAESVEGLKKEWVTAKAVMADLKGQVLNQAEFAIKDLGDAVETKKKSLVEIKGEIVLQNIKTLEKEFKKKEQKGKMQQ